jgi:hypothetical protein
VRSGFEASGERFAELIARHQQAFAMTPAGAVECALLGIGLVIGQPVFS